MIHPEEQPGETREAPSEFERVRGTYARGLESYLKTQVKNESGSINEPLVRFISNVVTERLERSITDLAPEEKTEFFESCPSLLKLDVGVPLGSSDHSRELFVNVRELGTTKPELRRPVIQELLRAALLTRAFNIKYKPGKTEIRPEDYLALLARLGTDRANIEDRLKTHEGFTCGSLDTSQEIPKAYEQDTELFIDLMTAFAERNRRGDTLNERWKALVGSSFENFGTKILATDEGLPYRPGKRAEDTKLARERFKLFEGKEGKPIKSYADLRQEVAMLTGDVERVNTLLAEERRGGSQLKQDLEVATRERGMLREDLARENEAREAAEAKAAALEERTRELLAIAGEKVGAFSKDTRAARMQQLAESPLPSKK